MQPHQPRPGRKSVITGSGAFADAYDLFVVDGVANILKDLGPAIVVPYTYTNNGTLTTISSYFTAYCGPADLTCYPTLFNNATQAWEPNSLSTWTPEYTPRYAQQTTGDKNSIGNAALIGSILGQLLFGLAGDVFGRKWSFVCTSLLLITGCIGSASSAAASSVACALNPAGLCGTPSSLPSSIASNVYLQLAIWRGLLGFGVGGEYPLASSIACEGATFAGRGKAVAWTFSMQGWGKLAAAFVNWAVISGSTYFGGTLPLDQTWRVALFCGCIPNLLTFYFRLHMHESKIYTAAAEAEAGSVQLASSKATPPLVGVKQKMPVGTMLAVLWEFRWLLLGTSLSWFLL